MSSPAFAPGAADLAARAGLLAERLSDGLKPLAPVAYNYVWSWLPDGSAVFRDINPHRWELSGMGMSMVDGCTVVGGMEGITTHASMTDIVHDRVSGTEMRGISVTEMSMGTVMDSEVSGALGIGIYCNDRSMCMIEHNTVVGTRPDIASGNPTRRGFGVLASFQSEADLRGNQLASNPVPMGAVINSQIAATH